MTMCWCFSHHRRYRWHNHRIRVILVRNEFAIELIPNGVIHMAEIQNVGQSISFSIEYRDQNGKKMDTAPTPDAAPVWANSNASVETLVAAADGSSAVATGIAAGSDTVRVQLMVAGTPYEATDDVTVNAVVPTLTSIGIVASAPTP